MPDQAGSEDGAPGPVITTEAAPAGDPSAGGDDIERFAAAAKGQGLPERAVPADDLSPRPPRPAWADLLRRVFAIDVLECPGCGARTRLLAAIHPPDATRAILECLDLPARAPPVEPARRDEEGPDPWETGFEGEAF